jgi:copper homeostasis protein
MKEDIKICKSLGCDGIVIGILKTNGEIDILRCAELIELAKPMPVAFHRSFDMSNDLFKALEDLINLGVVRVLTSGAANTALNGVEVIKKLVKQAQNRIEIMPGAGVNPKNISQILKTTGATNIHSSARVSVESKMEFRNPVTKMGTITEEYAYQQTSVNVVEQLIENISNC